MILTQLCSNLFVRLIEETFKQEEEHDCMQSNPPSKCDWILARIRNEKLESMNHDGNKLNNLEHSQVFFPPQVFLNFWTHCS